MASITVRNIDENLKRRLRIRAAENGRSMEQEVREILAVALAAGSKRSTNPGLEIYTFFKSWVVWTWKFRPENPCASL